MSGEIKITGGDYRGRKIATPGGETHPMGERERVALFNMIMDYVPGARVMDAYAGSGALGIEALSRGARETLFVEKSHVAMRMIAQNCYMLGLRDDQVAFYRGAVSAFYKRVVQEACSSFPQEAAMLLATFPEEVDIILADPPYEFFNSKEMSRLANGYLSERGILVLSHPDEAPEIPRFAILKDKKYAKAHITVYQREDANAT